MPTSDISSIPPIMNEVCRLQPQSVLDLGAGRGKYGVLCREYLDWDHAGNDPEHWTVRIDAVEGFEAYITGLHWSVYNQVWVEDFAANVDHYKAYDVVLMIDSLEHLTFEEGSRVLDTLLRYNNRVIVSVPWGPNYLEQGAVFGNEFERHRHSWDLNAFRFMGGTELYRGVCSVWSIPGRS